MGGRLGFRIRSEKAARRLVWAVDALGIEPVDRLLEIGLGHGAGVSLACEEPDGGTIQARDRSARMIGTRRSETRTARAPW
jgi:cyclopropane fatty-acyl-phospholipid synthase-like methyltransferase